MPDGVTFTAGTVTTVTPMKRGLKVSGKTYAKNHQIVTTVTPMKRGLKDIAGRRNVHGWDSYNRFPDEKGTESHLQNIFLPRNISVTTVTPMKRGLKEHLTYLKEPMDVGYNRCPDEKGTESCHRSIALIVRGWLQPLPR